MRQNPFLRRLLVALALPLLVGVFASSAFAAARVFVAVNEFGEIWEVDPTTGTQIAGFPLIPSVHSTRPGLAFDGTELFYTDENLNVVQVYSTTGVLNRTLPKPAGTEPGSGLGASATALYLVGLDGDITAIDKTTGAVISSFNVLGGAHALTFAGSRNSLFVTVNDSTTVKELSLAGVELNSLTVPDIFRGLGFSSASNVLYGTRGGVLYGVNPNTGAALPGYPVDITGLGGARPSKTGGLAADEVVTETCGDGTVNQAGETCDPPTSQLPNGATCRQDCTYCGDGIPDQGEQCDDGNTNDADGCRNNCSLPFCGDGKQDPNEACDDGNQLDGDGCSANCTVEPFCGDGIIQAELGEQCEPPNSAGCDQNCHATEICLDLIDNDGDGAIDCLDADCDCLPIGRDPGAIRFAPSGNGDLLAVHGSLAPLTAINPASEEIKILLTNVNGTIYEEVVPAGQLKQIGRNLFRYRNKLAQRNRSGLARFDVRFFPKRNNYTFVLKTYDDLSAATVAAMAFQVSIGDDGFLNQSVWQKLPNGWLLTLPGE